MNSELYVNELPSGSQLKKICKALAALDWIICGQEFERYHRYFKSEQEEYEGCEALIGFDFEEDEGLSLHLYFTQNECLIVPSECEGAQEADNKAFEKRIPKDFQAFYSKNYKNKDIPFVIFSQNGQWKIEKNFPIGTPIQNFEHLSGDAEFYKKWATDFWAGETHFLNENADLQIIKQIYQGEVLTEPMVLSLVSQVDDWRDLEEALDEMPYRFDF